MRPQLTSCARESAQRCRQARCCMSAACGQCVFTRSSFMVSSPATIAQVEQAPPTVAACAKCNVAFVPVQVKESGSAPYIIGGLLIFLAIVGGLLIFLGI